MNPIQAALNAAKGIEKKAVNTVSSVVSKAKKGYAAYKNALDNSPASKKWQAYADKNGVNPD